MNDETDDRRSATPDGRILANGESHAGSVGSINLDGPSGVLWGLDSPQLNANFVMLGEGESMATHVNDDLDVLLIVQAGSGSVVIDGVNHTVAADSVILVPKGSSRSISATRRMLYFSVHQRRERLGLRGSE